MEQVILAIVLNQFAARLSIRNVQSGPEGSWQPFGFFALGAIPPTEKRTADMHREPSMLSISSLALFIAV
jgi:hypothetical protein